MPSVCGEKGTNRRHAADFQGSETTLYIETIIVDVYHHKFVQIHKMCNTRSELWILSVVFRLYIRHKKKGRNKEKERGQGRGSEG